MIEPMSPEVQSAYDALKALSEPDRLMFGACWRAHGQISLALAALGILTTQTKVERGLRRDAENTCRRNLEAALKELGAIKVPART